MWIIIKNHIIIYSLLIIENNSFVVCMYLCIFLSVSMHMHGKLVL